MTLSAGLKTLLSLVCVTFLLGRRPCPFSAGSSENGKCGNMAAQSSQLTNQPSAKYNFRHPPLRGRETDDRFPSWVNTGGLAHAN